MKKLAVLTIILASICSFKSEAETDQAFYYIRLGEFCFTRQFNQQLFERLTTEGAQPPEAFEGAQGNYVNQSDFCSKFRAMVLAMKQAPSSNK